MIDAICDLVAAIRGTADASDRDSIREILIAHALSDPPQWMADFVCDIARGRTTDHLLPISRGYPLGESGLINCLLEIDANVCPLGMDDYGEGMIWRIPHLGIIVFIGRETKHDFYHGAILPATTDLNSWLRTECLRDQTLIE